jgi:hypothetical protein
MPSGAPEEIDARISRQMLLHRAARQISTKIDPLSRRVRYAAGKLALHPPLLWEMPRVKLGVEASVNAIQTNWNK